MPSDSFENFLESVHEKAESLNEDRKLPKKYKKGLTKEEKNIMKREVKETEKMSDDDPKAYEEWESDKKYKKRDKEPKKSKHTEEYEKRFGKEEALIESSTKGLKNKSEESGIAYGILKDVFDRGMAAWKTGHRPGVSPHQWAMGRVNSFITGGKTRTTTDKDLWAKHKKNKKKKD